MAGDLLTNGQNPPPPMSFRVNPMNTEQNTFMIPIPNYVKLLKTEKLQVHWISCDLKLFL